MSATPAPEDVRSARRTAREVAAGATGARARRLGQLCLAGVALGVLALRSVPPHAYSKDLQQEYLAALAFRDGGDVFAPVSDLAARYFPVPVANFPHPNPHPPVLTLLSVPLTFLPFPIVVGLWLALSLALLVAIGRWLGLSEVTSLALAAWPPLWWLLYIGQLELVVLALALLAWRAADKGHDWRAGALLGLAAALKLYPALLLAPYLARRRLRVVAAATLVFGLGQVGNLAVVGPARLAYYYTSVLPSVAGTYVRLGLNSSPYGALLRLFGGAGDVQPLIDAPGVALPAAGALSALALLALFWLKPEMAPLALLVGLPNGWGYYAVLGLPAIVAMLRRPELWTPTLVATVAASFVLPLANLMVPAVAPGEWVDGRAPAAAGLFAALQPAGYVALLALAVVAARSHQSGRHSDLRSHRERYQADTAQSRQGAEQRDPRSEPGYDLMLWREQWEKPRVERS